jgi:hypothetical protein
MPKSLNDGYEIVKAEELIPHPDNARRGDLGTLRESIRDNGFYGSLVVQRATNMILVGNHRYRAAIEEGLTEMPVIWVDVDDAEARRLLLVDNRTTDLASYDDARLKVLLDLVKESDAGLSGTGYDDIDYGDLAFQVDTVTPGYGTLNPTAISSTEGLDRFMENAIRTIVLPYSADVADTLYEMLDDLRKFLGYESNAAIVQELIERAHADLDD